MTKMEVFPRLPEAHEKSSTSLSSFFERARRDSNPQSSDLQSDALAVWPLARILTDTATLRSTGQDTQSLPIESESRLIGQVSAVHPAC